MKLKLKIRNIKLLNFSTYLLLSCLATDAVADAISGLAQRPENLTCQAPDRPVTDYTTQQVFTSLTLTSPIFMMQPPGDSSRWFLAQRDGTIVSFDNNQTGTNQQEILNLQSYLQFTDLQTANDSQQAGITSFAIHPDFPATPYIYVAINAKPSATENVFSTLYRFSSTDGGQTFDPNSIETLLSVEVPTPWHHIGTVAFGLDGYLYIGLGEGEGVAANLAQDLTDLRGSILRIDIDAGDPYAIPSDNPLVGTGLKEEIYAWGFRNPWRFSFDRITGELWLGDVGPDNIEEVNYVVKGGNYGWNTVLGTECSVPGCDTSLFVNPVLELDHLLVIAIIGGYVYRGNDIPGLVGTYIFGNGSGKTIRSLQYDLNNNAIQSPLLDSPIVIHSFAEDLDGELYFFRAFAPRIYKIIPNTATGTSPFPTLLSETGCMDPADPTKPMPGVIPYNVNTILWSDGAEKSRWFAVPDGSTITLQPDGDFLFPIGTVLIKQFGFDDSPHETRLLVRHDDGFWGAYTYEWESDLSDAELVGSIGKSKVLPNGVNWSYPSQEQCFSCHTDIAGTDIGLEILQLNGDYLYPTSGITANQLTTFDHIGLLTNALPAPPAELPALTSIDNATASDKEKARSYIHANCSGCHRPGSLIQANWDARFSTSLENMNACDVIPDHGDLGSTDGRLIKPGDSVNSIISLRTLNLADKRMPPSGTSIIDPVGTQIIKNWIDSLNNCNKSNNVTIYEDGEDGSTNGWEIYDTDPVGSSITNVFDDVRQSQVIQLSSDGVKNGFWLRQDDYSLWQNNEQFIISWAGQFDEWFSITVEVDTADGRRYMTYHPKDTDDLGTVATVGFGLGSFAKDGLWHTFVRDLKADLALAQPENQLISIRTIRVRGSGRIDNIKLLEDTPNTLTDTDGDGLINIDELEIYGTDINKIDTDDDGLNDSDELAYWGSAWNIDYDIDGLNNLADSDSDNDGISDGYELTIGTDPAVSDGTLYENAEDGKIIRWNIFDNDPIGATISNVFDDARKSQVIELAGNKDLNGYELSFANNDSEFIVQWSSAFAEFYSVVVQLNTSAGTRYIIYQPTDTSTLGSGSNVAFGIGSQTRNGQWNTIIRDLQADLITAQPNVSIISVKRLLIRGSGRIDDIRLTSNFLFIDNDNDTLSDQDEIYLYRTSPTLVDTDNDGLNDGDELAYWGSAWNIDYDTDGLNNLIDNDSDDDNINDGDELDAGSDPADPGWVLYENAEDGKITRWSIYDNDPVGATVINIYDDARESQVIELAGNTNLNGYELSFANNSTKFTVQWSSAFSSYYSVVVQLNTSAGTRYMVYQPVDTNSLGSGGNIAFGIGTQTRDGQWNTTIRDLQADLIMAQPNVSINSVKRLLVRGNGRLDDIRLFSE